MAASKSKKVSKKKKDNTAIKRYGHSDQFVLRRADKSPPLKPDREREVIARWKADNNDQEALHIIFMHNQRLVAKEAGKHIGRGLEFCELVQEGNIGMFRALKKFKPELNYKFSTYATWWIKEGIDRAIKNKARMIRIPVNVQQVTANIQKACSQSISNDQVTLNSSQLAERFGMSVEDAEKHKIYLSSHISLDKPLANYESINIGDILYDKEELQPQSVIEVSSDHSKVREWVNRLNTEDAEFVYRMFGLIDSCPRTRVQMAELYQTTEQFILRREKKILEQLRQIASQAEINGVYLGKKARTDKRRRAVNDKRVMQGQKNLQGKDNTVTQLGERSPEIERPA